MAPSQGGAPLIGQTLNNRYTVTALLGSGAMGDVYQAADSLTNQTVAVKVLDRKLTLDPEIVERFKREGEALRQLRHRHIVGFVDTFQHERQQVIVMECVSGGSLHQLIKRGPLPVEQARQIAIDLCDALTSAHRLNIIHRDIKPENVLMAEDGTPKLTDFGVARLVSEGTRLTGTGTQVGTPYYMSPEAWQGQPLDAQADIWSLGIVLYEMLAGVVPFGGDTLVAVMNKVLTAPLQDIKKLRSETPPALVKIVRRMLERDKAKRYPSLRQVAVDLEAVTIAPAASAPALGSKVSGNGKWWALAVVGVVLVLGVCLAGVGGGTLVMKMMNPAATALVVTPSLPSLVVMDTPVLTSPATPAPQIVIQTQVVVQTQVVKETQIVEKPVTVAEVAAALPRNETLYFNGQQWGAVACWNPYSSNCNNGMALAALDNARVTMFETPYLYNMLDGQQYPLLADGPYAWNDAHTEITFKLKAAAKWSDGAPVTADDVAYTWATHAKYSTSVGDGNKDYVDTVTAVDAHTVLVKAKLNAKGQAVNPLIVAAYLSTNYVLQKAWTQKLEARTDGDATRLMADTADDVVYSGPYRKFFTDDTKVILVRDDNYWGKDASMWGKLPIPKYLAHVIYQDDAASFTAFQAGEVDVSQQFNANVQDLWLKNNLPISTFLPDAPYGIGASLPSAFYNLGSYGLDQPAVRKAIAMAIDYDTIIAQAMTNQSATFAQVPRSLMNPTPGEQAMYDKDVVKDLQWVGNDIEGAKKLLDAAGITAGADGLRRYKGKTLHYVATCPNGWSDWQAAIEVVAAAGKAIGIDITTNYPEWSVYQTVVTKSDAPFPAGYDIFMMWSDGAGPAEPWGRIRHLMSSEFVGMASNWNGNWGGYKNPAADKLIQAIPTETDPAKLKDDYTQLVKIYLTDVPSFTLMYRPQSFHTVNESVWTNFPHQGDGTQPPVPPLLLTDGWSIAGLYNLKRVSP